MTESLVFEIMEHLADSRKPDHYNQFTNNCIKLFPVGREFANYRQLEQFVNLFLEGWKISKHRDGNTFKCFYSAPKKKKKNDIMFEEKFENSKMSLKESIKCPFVIRFSIPGIKKRLRPPIFHKVKITYVNAEHTCNFCVQSFRVAKRMSTSVKK